MNARNLIVQANVWLTGLFGVTAAYAAWSFSTPAQWVGAVTAMVLFAIGVFAFLWSYWNAVQRSRTEEIAVSQLYLLLGDAIPKGVRCTMLTALAFQFTVALITTLVRPEGPSGGAGSSLAVGFLVPMLGFGLNGLWAAYFGRFNTRSVVAKTPAPNASVHNSSGAIGQNADHG